MARNKEFQTHRLTDAGLGIARYIGEMFDDLLDELVGMVGKDGREMPIVRTKLEEACFFAKKALAVKPENQEPEVR